MSGRDFVSRTVRLNSMLSGVALVIVLGCAGALLDLTTELWHGFWIGMGITTVLCSPVSMVMQRRVMAPVLAWLDHSGPPDVATTQRAFVAMLELPMRTANGITLSWLMPAVLISIGMEIFYADLWTLWDASVLVVSGLAAGFAVSTLTGLLLKGGDFARVRDALARAVGSSEERRRLSPHMSIRTKLPSMLTGACLVPVLFAVLIAFDQGSSSLESFAVRWTTRVLADIPAD